MKVGLLDDRRAHFGLLLLTAAVFSAVNWLKLGSLWGDASRSLFEIYRASRGEIPYRDFTFPYPPLAVAVCGSVLRWFGATFPVQQIALDLLSLACITAAWSFAQKLAPRRTALLATLAFTLLGATNGGNFALFSLAVYTPAILFGAIGILLVCSGVVDTIHNGLTVSAIAYLVSGGLISCLSRPECAAGAIAALFCLTVIEFRSPNADARWRRFMRLERIAALLLLPSLCVYAVLLAWLGPRALLEGLGAYGMAAIACPWWPTGFGSLGGLAALAGATAAAGAMALAVRRVAKGSFGRDFLLPLLTAAGALLWLTYTVVFFKELANQQAIRQGFLAVAYYLVSANTFVLPIMWASCLMFVVEAFSYWNPARERTPDEKTSFVLLGLIFVLATRDLFNNAISQATQTSPMLYATIVPAFPLLARHAFRRWKIFRSGISFDLIVPRINALAGATLCLFCCIRVVGYGVRQAATSLVEIQTDAGPVKLADGLLSSRVYEFLKTHTVPGEPIADMSYGGGINFALHRPSPLYTTQFVNFRPTPQHRQRDYIQLRGSNVGFVIGRDPPAVRYGTEIGCAFPRFVWKAERCPDEADVDFPVLQLVREQYRPDGRFGDIIVYLNKERGSL